MSNTISLLNKHKFTINNKIIARIPTIAEVRGDSFYINGSDEDEENYFSLVQVWTATPADLIVQLHQSGVTFEEYQKIDDYSIFLMLFQSIPKDKFEKYSHLLFDGLDLSKFEISIDTQTNKPILYNQEDDIVINKMLYMQLSSFFCTINGIEKNKIKSANETAYDYKAERMLAKSKKKHNYSSRYDSQIIAMVNHEGFKYNFETVQQLTIYDFMMSVKQILKKYTADCLNQGVYMGTVKYSDVKNSLDWIS